MSINGVTECIQIPVSQGQFIVDKKSYDDPDLKCQNGDSRVSSFFFPSNITLVFSIMTAGQFILNIPNIRMTWSHYPPRQITTSCVTYKKKWRRWGEKTVDEGNNVWSKKDKFLKRKKIRGDSFFLRDKRAGHDRFNRFGEKKENDSVVALFRIASGLATRCRECKKNGDFFQSKFVLEHNNEHPGHHLMGESWPVSSPTDDLTTSKSVEQEGRMSLIVYISQQSVIKISVCV